MAAYNSSGFPGESSHLLVAPLSLPPLSEASSDLTLHFKVEVVSFKPALLAVVHVQLTAVLSFPLVPRSS